MEDIGYSLLEIATPVLVAALTWVSARLASFIKSKIDNSYLEGALVRLNDAVFTVVKDLNQTMVDEIRKAKDPASDGGVSLTDAEKAKIKAAALEHLKSYLGAKGLNEIGKVMGLSEGALDGFLGAKIEAAVSDVKI